MLLSDALQMETQRWLQQGRALKVRESELSDVEDLQACIDIVAREGRYLLLDAAPPVAEVRSMLDECKRANAVHLVMLDGNAVVGWCEVWRSRYWGMGHCGCLWLGLLPAYRGQGLGKWLIGEAVDRAFNQGFDRVELDVFSGNTRAARLYERMGFVREGIRRTALKRDGRVEDVIFYGLLKEEWIRSREKGSFLASVA